MYFSNAADIKPVFSARHFDLYAPIFPIFASMKIASKFILLGLFFLLLGASCQRAETNGKQLVIASLRGPSSVGMLHFIDSVSRMENADIDIQIYDEPLQVRKLMLDGSADFAVLPTTMAALLYNKGMDYRVKAVPMWGTLYLCGNDTTIQCWDDLRGKKVYLMAKGMTPDVLFQFLLTQNGLAPYQDVDLDYRFPTHIDLANATMAGRADLSVISEPYLSMALLKNPSLHILFDLDAEWNKVKGVPLAETAFLCRGNLAETKQRIDRIVGAYATSVDWVNAHPAEAAHLAVQYNIIPDSLAAFNSIPRSNLNVVRTDEVRQDLKDYLQVFFDMDAQIIGGQMPNESFYE